MSEIVGLERVGSEIEFFSYACSLLSSVTCDGLLQSVAPLDTPFDLKEGTFRKCRAKPLGASSKGTCLDHQQNTYQKAPLYVQNGVLYMKPDVLALCVDGASTITYSVLSPSDGLE